MLVAVLKKQEKNQKEKKRAPFGSSPPAEMLAWAGRPQSRYPGSGTAWDSATAEPGASGGAASGQDRAPGQAFGSTDDGCSPGPIAAGGVLVSRRCFFYSNGMLLALKL